MDKNRNNYWNEEYFKYWVSRVEEANEGKEKGSSIVAGDQPLPNDMVYIDAIKLLDITNEQKVLEVGCGFGRSLPFLSSLSKEVYAADISSQMVDAARKYCQDFSNIRYLVSEAEKMDLQSGMIDHVSCFAVFDALHQREALCEMNRILADSGKALITGKNDNYNDQDIKALEAEEGARGKAHPNFFTDLSALIANLEEFGFKLEMVRFFRYRGDFAKNIYELEMPDKFYEYMLILEKTGCAKAGTRFEISSPYSKTYRRTRISSRED